MMMYNHVDVSIYRCDKMQLDAIDLLVLIFNMLQVSGFLVVKPSLVSKL